MSQRRDDTTEPPEHAPVERAPGDYYYDDATGYEPYDPAADEDEDDPAEADGAKNLNHEITRSNTNKQHEDRAWCSCYFV